MFLLLDANVVVAYYLPRAHSSKRVRERIENVLNSVRSGASAHFLYVANFCVAEIFSTFAKHAFSTWNSHVIKAGGTIDKRVYLSLREQFTSDIHNGRFFYHYELSRYHILGVDLVSPIDHYFQMTRGRRRLHVPAGTFDQLLISMGVHLAHVHGADNVCLVSADDRLARLLGKCRDGIPARTVKRLKLDVAEEVAGKPFSEQLFPRCVNLKTATNAELAALFGAWPLPVGHMPKVYRWLRL